MIVWIDFETTGLDPRQDSPLELATVITDDDLNEVTSYEWLIIPGWGYSAMIPLVREMHTKNGLIHDLNTLPTMDFVDVDKALAGMIREVCGEERPPMAGSSIKMDRDFMEVYFPESNGLLHYRNIDVSSIKELVKRWHPTLAIQVPEEDKAHRAMADIRASIAELKYYRETVFVPSVKGVNA